MLRVRRALHAITFGENVGPSGPQLVDTLWLSNPLQQAYTAKN